MTISGARPARKSGTAGATTRKRLASRKCSPLPAGTRPLSEAVIARWLTQVRGWRHADGALRRSFRFADFHQTMAFVNAVAWIAHVEDHHPELAVSYNRCDIAWNTHSVGGISMNDFICAARVDAMASGAGTPRSTAAR